MNRALRSWRGTAIRPLEDLYRDMDNLVTHLFGDEERQRERPSYAPTVNIAETEAQYEVTADLPGIQPEDVNVEVHEGQVTITGKREVRRRRPAKRITVWSVSMASSDVRLRCRCRSTSRRSQPPTRMAC